MEALLNSLTEAELAITRSTTRSALGELDEDALLELHGRVRQVRNKYLGQYRRQAATTVQDAGSRGAAYPRNQRARDKLEVFETALASVSTALGTAARRTAAELRSERLAAARTATSDRSVPPSSTGREAAADTSAARRPPTKSTGRRKRDASDIAVGRRNQARRDNR
jgi:hypothetical protein